MSTVRYGDVVQGGPAIDEDGLSLKEKIRRRRLASTEVEEQSQTNNNESKEKQNDGN